MRVPDPAGLRCQHPCLAVPRVNGRRLSLPTESREEIASLRELDRLRVAAQLLALTSLLAELDLWPGRAALRRTMVVATESGPRASVRGFPRPLAAVMRRLGGGEGAATALRAAAIVSIGQASGLPPSQLPEHAVDPGPFLHLELASVLDRLPQPLDATTARSLWMLSLPPLRLPFDGEVVLRQVAEEETIDRLVAAAWSSLERARRPCLVWRVGAGQGTGPIPAQGARGVLLVTGVIGGQELASAERWAGRPGCAALVIGRFPQGWSPPGPGAGATPWRLAVTGVTRERARQVREQWSSRPEPWSRASALELTARARHRFRKGIPPEESAETLERVVGTHDARILSLLPEGLPEGFLVLHAPDLLARLRGREALPGVTRCGDRWRLLEPRPLERYALHSEVAGLFPHEDPRWLRHLALAEGVGAELERWAQGRLDALAIGEVGEVLGLVAPGALGDQVDLAIAEDCLWRHDLSGARSALRQVSKARRAPLELWISAVDTAPGAPIVGLDEECVRAAPRAAAAVAVLALTRAVRRRDVVAAEAARARLAELAGRLAPPVARWVEILEVAADTPALLRDRGWRRDVIGGHRYLRREVLHRAGLRCLDADRPGAAMRLLSRAAALATDPGLRGIVEHDLGQAAHDLGRRTEAELHYQRAFVLLEAAGFRHLQAFPLGNLATSDLDALRLDRAAARLQDILARHEDPLAQAELARLELARGRLDSAWRILDGLPSPDSAGAPGLVEGVHFLYGVRELLMAGNLARARAHLVDGGSEGGVWLAVVEALEGAPDEGRPCDDVWGVAAAARWLRHGHPSTSVGDVLDDGDPRLAFAAALIERVAPGRARLDGHRRRRLAADLDAVGASGWARSLRAGFVTDRGWLAAVARLAEVRDLGRLSAHEAESLVAGLDLEGLELWSEEATAPMVRLGDGSPGAESRIGRLKVVPLGGELGDDPSWRLVRALLEPDGGLTDAGEGSSPDPDVVATGIHGSSPAVAHLRREIARLAPMGMTVLLLGETGVGKDVAARAIHRLSGRRGRFVAVNVAAIPDTLLESELFGSVRGAFTGADRDRRGLVEAAEGGTLFLDEIGDLGVILQAKLLRFLETFEIRPVGSDRVRVIDVRVVAATHHDLEQRTRDGSFRSDLYYRISAAPISIPPLRERRDDVLVLRDLFQGQLEGRENLPHRPWTAEAEELIVRHPWPGNVRELRHVVETARIRARGARVTADDLGFPQKAPVPKITRWNEALDQFRRGLLSEALEHNGGNRSATARQLGISRQALLYHLRALGLDRAVRRDGQKEADRAARWRKEEV